MNINRYNFSLLIVIAIGLLLITPLLGKEKADQYSQPTLISVIVVEGEAVEKTATVYKLTQEVIKAKGITNAAEALEKIPGLHVRTGAKGESYVRLRGFRQREIALLIDGIPVSSPYDGQLDLSSISMESVERIEVIKGASSVLYGSNAMGGVINIITRQSSGKKHLSIQGKYGTGNNADLSALAQGSLGKVRYMISGGYYNKDSFPLSKDYLSQPNQPEGERENSSKQSWNGKISLSLDLNKSTQASINYSHVNLEKGLPHHESDTKAKYWRFSDWNEGILDVAIDKSFQRSSLKTRVFYQYFNNVLDSYDDGTYSTQEGKYAFTSSYKDYSWGGDAFYRLFANKSLLFKSALRFQHFVHRDQDDLGEEWNRFNINTLSIPLEAEWTPINNISITSGTSMDIMFFKNTANDSSKSTFAFNPQLALMVQPVKDLLLKASISRKTRFPNMKELFSSTSGNPDLKPMKSNNFELGAEYKLSTDMTISLVGFYSDIKDLINRDKKNDPYLNVDRAVFKGIEAGFQWRFSHASFLSFNYTRLTALDKSSKDKQSIQYRPKHKLDMALMVNLPAGFNLYTDCGVVSTQVYYDDKDNEQVLDAYTLVDAKLSKKFGEKFELFIGVRNLFDINYYESEGFPQAGRTIFGGIRFEVF